MSNKLKTFGILGLSAIAMMMTSCSSDFPTNYPTNAGDQIVEVDSSIDSPYNTLEKYYETLTGDALNARLLDKILYDLAIEKCDIDATWLDNEVKERMIDSVSSGSYDTDYKFDEIKYVRSLTSNLYDIKNLDKANSDYVILPKTEYASIEECYNAIFKCDYSDYIEKYLKPEIIREKLVAQYIYDESYSSIGSTNARNVKIIAITDRSDKPGMARKLINYFLDTYVKVENSENYSLEILAKLWKGVDTTDAEKELLKSRNIENMYDKIKEEIAKIDLDEKDKSDLALESQYTGSYTYSIQKGEELATNSLRKENYITEGYFLRSTGLSSLPDALRTRIFSSNYTTDGGTTKDVTRTMPNGIRYVTAPQSEQGSTDDIVYYDSSSKTYYITEIHDVISSAVLRRNDSDSEEVIASKKSRATTVAFEMATTSSYENNSIVFYLEELEDAGKISWHDESFYNYISSNYPDVFEEDDD